MNLSKFKDKKITLLGMGIENISVARFLRSHNIDFTILDKAPIEKLSKEAQKVIKDGKCEIRTGEDYLSHLKDFDLIVRTPGIPYLTPQIQEAKKNGAEITSSTKLFFELCPAKIIGVTGTKGKGTTASLIYEIAKRKFEARNPKSEITAFGGIPAKSGTNLKSEIRNSKPVSDFDIRISDFQPKVYLVGNIGIPSFDVIEKIQPNDLVVFELSSFQLQDLEISPHIAVITNLADDHLDYHQSLEEYQATKQAIFKFQKNDDFAIINKDYPESFRLKDFGLAKKFFFSSKEEVETGAFVDNDGNVFTTMDGKELICRQDEIKLIGRHNLENIAAAAIVGKILQIPVETISETTKDFEGLPHRIEFVQEIDSVKYYNDSFSTNPTPTIAAIKSFSVPITLILGGSEKGADFSELAKEIVKSTVKNVIVIGKEEQKIKDALKDISDKIQIIDGDDNIEGIVKQAKKSAIGGGVVLFSPACASFDMFKNYKDRGERFREAIIKLT